MSIPPTAPATANDRLKRSDGTRVASGLVLATLLHLLAFVAWPTMDVEAIATVDDEVELVSMDDIELPPPPEPLTRPLRPVVGGEVEADVTVEPVAWDDVPSLPPPPPDPEARATGESEPFVVYEVAPRLLNPEEAQRRLERVYPAVLRDAGIGGQVWLGIHIDEDGEVTEVRVDTPSPHGSLDAAALRVADVMRFSPALNRDHRVAVWIRLPVVFRVR